MPNLEGLQAMKRLISFLESYAESDKDFALALNSEMESFFSGRKKPVRAQDPYAMAEELGDEGFKKFLNESDDTTILGFARFLGIKRKKLNDSSDGLREKILFEIQKSLNHGRVFIKENNKEDTRS